MNYYGISVHQCNISLRSFWFFWIQKVSNSSLNRSTTKQCMFAAVCLCVWECWEYKYAVWEYFLQASTRAGPFCYCSRWGKLIKSFSHSFSHTHNACWLKIAALPFCTLSCWETHPLPHCSPVHCCCSVPWSKKWATGNFSFSCGQKVHWFFRRTMVWTLCGPTSLRTG